MLAQQLAQAEEHFIAGRFDAVAEICTDLISSDPNCHQAFYLLGRTCLTVGRGEQALELVGRAVQLNEAAAPYHTELGNILASNGQYEAAADCYRRAIELAPDFVDPLVNLGAALQLLNRPEEAVEIYRKAIELVPDAAMLHYNLGAGHRAAGDVEGAIESYRRAAELEPGWAELHQKLGSALNDHGDFADAIESHRRALSLAPEDPENHIGLAQSLLASGKAKAALSTCDAYMASHPYNSGLVACRALVLNELGSRDAAARLLDLGTFVRTFDIAPPAAFGSLEAFNAALAEEAEQHPTLEFNPPKLATREGFQSREMFDRPGPAVALLMERVDESVRRYIAGLPDDPSHPLVASAPRRWSLTGWSVILQAQGHQMPHIHPSGWLSGVYYVDIPSVVAESGDAHEGWIEFGRPPGDWACAADPIVELVQPEAGRMVLFPSYVYHRTIPFESDERRICYAFDIMARA